MILADACVLCGQLEEAGTIQFLGTRYRHVLTERGEDGTTSNLYAAVGESPENWTTQVGVCHWPKITDFAPIVGPTVRDLRPQFVRDAQVFSREGDQSNQEVLIEVYLKSRQEGYLEYRLLRFVKEEGVEGIKLYLFAERSRATDQDLVVDPQLRQSRFDALADAQFEVTLHDPRTVPATGAED
jgi:hypothetical protein